MLRCFFGILIRLMTHLLGLFNLCRHDSHIFYFFILRPPLFVSSSPAAWLMWCSRGRNRWRAGEGLGLHPPPPPGRCCGVVISLFTGQQLLFTRGRETGESAVVAVIVAGWLMLTLILTRWLISHITVTLHKSGVHGHVAPVLHWCCTGVAPAAVSPLPHQGGAADHTGSNLQQTATYPACSLTFKFEGNTLCIVFVWNTRPTFIWCTMTILYKWNTKTTVQ